MNSGRKDNMQNREIHNIVEYTQTLNKYKWEADKRQSINWTTKKFDKIKWGDESVMKGGGKWLLHLFVCQSGAK